MDRETEALPSPYVCMPYNRLRAQTKHKCRGWGLPIFLLELGHLSSFHRGTPSSPALGLQDVQEKPLSQVLGHQTLPERDPIAPLVLRPLELNQVMTVLFLNLGMVRCIISQPL